MVTPVTFPLFFFDFIFGGCFTPCSGGRGMDPSTEPKYTHFSNISRLSTWCPASCFHCHFNEDFSILERTTRISFMPAGEYALNVLTTGKQIGVSSSSRMQSNWISCFRGQLEDFSPFGRTLGMEEEGKGLTGGDMIFSFWRCPLPISLMADRFSVKRCPP
jgi:hypothetical protein